MTERRSATVLPEAADTFRLNITVACERSSPPWSEQTRRCYVAAGRSSDLDNCNRTLTADQIAALNQLLDRAAAGE